MLELEKEEKGLWGGLLAKDSEKRKQEHEEEKDDGAADGCST